MNRLSFIVSEPPKVQPESDRARFWRLWSERLAMFAFFFCAAVAAFHWWRMK
jgi:hypothetical protein